MEEKIKKVFEAFKVDQVWHDDQEVYLTEKAGCTRVTREDFINSTKKSKNGK